MSESDKISDAGLVLTEYVEEAEPDDTIRQLPKLFTGALTPKQKRWLSAYAMCGQIRGAERRSGVNRRWHYFWLEENDYANAFAKAREIFADQAESEVIRRGIEGVRRPLHYKGRLTGDAIREYSDTLAAMILKGMKEQYRDGASAVIGPTQINLTVKSQSLEVKASSDPIQLADLDSKES